MNIAITTDNWRKVSGSTENCQHFMVYEIGAGKVLNKHPLSILAKEALGKSDIIHENHPLDGVMVLITAGMKKKTENNLKKVGITPFVTDETNPDEAVQHYLKGDLHVEPAGLHREHHFHQLKDEKGFVPAAGTRTLHDIN
jgi:predicted Fe-Mo cluster-binding NifX family protein